MMYYYSSLLNLNFSLLKHKIRANNSLPNVLNVLNDCLEMGRRIIGSSDENIVCFTGAHWTVQRRNGHKSISIIKIVIMKLPTNKKKHSLVVNRTQKVDPRSNLQFRLISLDDCADNSDMNVLGTNIVGRRYHGDVDVLC